MSILDGLNDGEIQMAVVRGAGVLGEISRLLGTGVLTQGDRHTLSSDEALAVARFWAAKSASTEGKLPYRAETDPLMPELQLVSEDGKVWMGTGIGVDDTLANVKSALLALVDREANRRIVEGEGFPYADLHFSASVNAQTKWLGLYNSRASLTYPYVVPTKDDADFYAIADAATVEAMYAALTAYVAGFLAESSAAKNAITSAEAIAVARTAYSEYLNPA